MGDHQVVNVGGGSFIKGLGHVTHIGQGVPLVWTSLKMEKYELNYIQPHISTTLKDRSTSLYKIEQKKNSTAEPNAWRVINNFKKSIITTGNPNDVDVSLINKEKLYNYYFPYVSGFVTNLITGYNDEEMKLLNRERNAPEISKCFTVSDTCWKIILIALTNASNFDKDEKIIDSVTSRTHQNFDVYVSLQSRINSLLP